MVLRRLTRTKVGGMQAEGVRGSAQRCLECRKARASAVLPATQRQKAREVAEGLKWKRARVTEVAVKRQRGARGRSGRCSVCVGVYAACGAYIKVAGASSIAPAPVWYGGRQAGAEKADTQAGAASWHAQGRGT